MGHLFWLSLARCRADKGQTQPETLGLLPRSGLVPRSGLRAQAGDSHLNRSNFWDSPDFTHPVLIPG
jgi:hypothetical protein